MRAGVLERATRGVMRHPSGVLLVVQLVGVLLYPFIETSGNRTGRLTFEVFGALVLALAIWSVRHSAGPIWIPIGLGVVASGMSIADALTGFETPQLVATSAIFHALLLSFTNLSSTGLSDVAPIAAHARSVVMLEQLAGLAYVALIVSRLVGLTLARQQGGSTLRQPR